MLNMERDAEPEFGFRPGVPLHRGMRDCTEVDLRIGDLLVEAKLTESHCPGQSRYVVHFERRLAPIE